MEILGTNCIKTVSLVWVAWNEILGTNGEVYKAVSLLWVVVVEEWKD